MKNFFIIIAMALTLISCSEEETNGAGNGSNSGNNQVRAEVQREALVESFQEVDGGVEFELEAVSGGDADCFIDTSGIGLLSFIENDDETYTFKGRDFSYVATAIEGEEDSFLINITEDEMKQSLTLTFLNDPRRLRFNLVCEN